MAEQFITVDRQEDIVTLVGPYDEHLHIIEKEFAVAITVRDGLIKITGDEKAVNDATGTINSLIFMIVKGEQVTKHEVEYASSLSKDKKTNEIKKLVGDLICITTTGKPVKPKTIVQKEYVDRIAQNTVVFGVGPAGTGKTYLAVAMAVKAFKAGEVTRIILTRPAVEAGEKLGFLPGDLQTKVDPYLRPLYDALFDMLGSESFAKHIEKGTIEVAPLAYMRGRTLEDAFIILDEAQNTTPEQMKMFLTRLGVNSKAVITGDVTQIDLPDNKVSGLVNAIKVLKSIDDIEIVQFSHGDVVRNKIVMEIIKAYEKYGKEKGK